MMAKLTALVTALHTTVQELVVRLDRMEQRLASLQPVLCVPKAGGCQAKTRFGQPCEGAVNRRQPETVLAGGKQYAVCSNHRNVKVVLDAQGGDVPVDGQKMLTA